MNSINHGMFRVAVLESMLVASNLNRTIDRINDVISPYNLSVWDEPKTLQTVMTGKSDGIPLAYVDILVVEQELYGEQPIKNIIDKLSALMGVVGVIFIDTASPYNVPIFKYHGKPSDPVIKNLKRSYVKEVADDYKQLLLNLVQD